MQFKRRKDSECKYFVLTETVTVVVKIVKIQSDDVLTQELS